MKIKLKKLSQEDIEARKASYDIFVELKEKKMKGLIQVTRDGDNNHCEVSKTKDKMT